MALYGKVDYWNERYNFKNEQYEWLQSYHATRHLLTPELLSPADGVHPVKPRRTIEVMDRHGNMVTRSVIDPVSHQLPASSSSFPPRDQCRVLILGCGNSPFGEHMLKDGWTGGIVQVDFSSVVIRQMKQRYDDSFYAELQTSQPNGREVKRMEFICADVTSTLSFSDGSFDLIICKGTLDSILCSRGSVANARRMMQESCRLLHATHGSLVVITYGNPDTRIVYFENEGKQWWNAVAIHPISNQDVAKSYYAYICRRHPDGPTQSTVTAAIDDSIVQSNSNEENDASFDRKPPPKGSNQTNDQAPPKAHVFSFAASDKSPMKQLP